ncbi:MAG TPA: YihY/virulence factor BrkB family protein [Roseiarcus sp.]
MSAGAGERDRGRHAPAPWDIPGKGWKDILWRTYAKINETRLLLVAAGVVFYSLIALFPAITAFVSLYSLFADPSTIDSQVSALSTVLAGGAVDIVHEELKRLTANRSTSLSLGVIVGTLVALWSANAGTKAIIDALNIAYGEEEKRSFLRLNLVSLLSPWLR